MDNIELFNYSINNIELYRDHFYVKEKIIITKERGELNGLIKNNQEIIDLITTFEISHNLKNNNNDEIIEKIISLLNTSGINNSEFTNYWAIHDMSYSSYEKLSFDSKKVFIQDMLYAYIDNRHNMYKSHGYSVTSLQVRSDSIAHKRSSSLGSNKVEGILQELGVNKFNGPVKETLNKDNFYILPDKDGEKTFKFMINYLNVGFKWSKSKQGKNIDFLIKKNEKIYVIEHKHMKEGGGGQDKQIVEVIDFIKYGEKNIGYISFLDGIYFNNLGKDSNEKAMQQVKHIKKHLKKYKNNYFVNTEGFKKLMGEL